MSLTQDINRILNSKSYKDLSAERQEEIMQDFREGKVVLFPVEFSCYITRTCLICMLKTVEVIPISEINALDLRILEKGKNESHEINVIYSQDKNILLPGKYVSNLEEAYGYFYYCLTYYDHDIYNYHGHNVTYENYRKLQDLKKQYEGKFKVERLPSENFRNYYNSFAIYYDYNDKPHALIIADICCVIKMVKLPAYWLPVSTVYNKNGIEGLGQVIDEEIEKEDSLKYTMKENRGFGVVFLVGAIMFFFVMIAYFLTEDEDLWAGWLFMFFGVFSAAPALHFLLWKVELCGSEIRYRNLLGITKKIQVHDLTQIKYDVVGQEYKFYIGKKKAFSVRGSFSEEIKTFVKYINIIHKKGGLRIPPKPGKIV